MNDDMKKFGLKKDMAPDRTMWQSAIQKLANGGTIIYSGLPNEDDEHREGIGIMLSKKAAKCLIEWQPVSERIITVCFSSMFQKV